MFQRNACKLTFLALIRDIIITIVIIIITIVIIIITIVIIIITIVIIIITSLIIGFNLSLWKSLSSNSTLSVNTAGGPEHTKTQIQNPNEDDDDDNDDKNNKMR